LVLEAYCDESGIHEGASHCVLVGFVGSARRWRRFEGEWARAASGVEFHGQRFFSRAGRGRRVKPYDDWDDQKARAYLLRLVGAITSTNFTPIGGVVEVAAFRKLTLSERKYFTGAVYRPHLGRFVTSGAPSRPWAVGFVECLHAATRAARRDGEKVDFIFDRQNEYAPHATELYERAKEKAEPAEFRDQLGELAFKDKAGVGGLQAADLFAHAAYRRSGLPVKVNDELDLVTLRLRAMTHRRIVHFDEATFRGRLHEVPSMIRARWS
jgi:hypothetical protein